MAMTGNFSSSVYSVILRSSELPCEMLKFEVVKERLVIAGRYGKGFFSIRKLLCLSRIRVARQRDFLFDSSS